MKACTRCGAVYPATLEYFHRHRAAKGGLRPTCKECHRLEAREYNKTHPEERRAYRDKNREHYRELQREWLEKHPGYHAERYRRNPEAGRAKVRAYRQRNAEELYRREKERFENDIQFRISKIIKNRIRDSLLDGKQGRRWESLVGYSIDDLMSHLERQFTKGMTWDNYGEWHIDHIRPVSDFNYVSYEDDEFKACWSLWNLQPLWAHDNMSKKDKCEAPPLPLVN